MPTKSFLFVDQVRSTEQLTSLGDQAAHAVRRGLFDLLRQATEVSGGHEVDFTGDGLFAAFDGAVEAVEAAVLMQQLCFSFNARQLVPARLGLRIGVHSGEPLVSEGGGYFGVAVVVASRLCSTAQEGQILVSDVVRSLVAPRGTHEFASVGELSLRGVPEPVTGYQVWWKPDTQPPRLPEPLAAMRSGAFVGRTAERQRIESAWQAVQAGGRRFVLVSGDRGMGVSRLLAEVAEQARIEGAAIWFGRADDRAERLAPWSEAVLGWASTAPRAELRLAMGSRAGDLLRLVPGLADLVPRLPAPPPMSPSSEVFLVADAVDELCARWSQHQPLLVVLDDLENADPASLTVLRRLVESNRAARVMIVGGYEPSQVGTVQLLAAVGERSDLVDLRLTGLSPDEVEQLVGSVNQAPVIPASLRAVLAESEGSPYFVLQMATSMRERTLTRQVGEAAGRAEGLRTDLRLQREEITLGLRQLEQLRSAGDPAEAARLDPDGTPPAPGTCPYQGLLTFGAADADNFFGRESLTAELVARLVSSRFLAVVGPSGSGKSSVVNAGVLPALTAGAVPGSEIWVPTVVSPAGGRLTDAVAAARLQAPDRPLVFVVDQLEQLWTQHEAEAREQQVDFLVRTATDPERADLVIVAMRADYYGRAADYPALAELMADSHVLAGPMTAAELRAAIELPARRAGLALEPGLAQAVIDDVGDQPGNLPLLSTALMQTWERRRGRSLTLTGYAETGGARKAIAHLADAAYDDMPGEQQEAARRVLLRLAAPGVDGEDVARPAPLAEFGDDVTRSALARLADRRLVTIGQSTVQVAHEALMREWPRLRGWLDADRTGRRTQHQIAAAATEWIGSGRDDTLLFRGARLAGAEEWAATHHEDLTDAERHFLGASVAARQIELTKARRAVRRLRALALGLVLLLVVAVGAGGFAAVQRREASARANQADARGLAAQAISLSGQRNDLALILAVEGYRRDPSLTSQTGLLSALNGARYLVGYRNSFPLGIRDLQTAEDGRSVVALTSDGALRRYASATGDPRAAPIVDGLDQPRSLSLSSDGKRIAFVAAGGAQVVDAATGAAIGPRFGDGESQVMLSPDGQHIAWKSEDTPVTVAQVATGRVLSRISLGDYFGSFAFRPGGTELVVGGFDGDPVLRRFRIDGSAIGPTVRLGELDPVNGNVDPVIGLRYSPAADRVLVIHLSGGSRLVDSTSLQSVGRPFDTRGDGVVDASFRPDGRTVAVSAEDGTIRVANAKDGFTVATVQADAGTTKVRFLDDHRMLVTGGSGAAEYDLAEHSGVARSTQTPEGSGPWAVTPGLDKQSILMAKSEGLFTVDQSGESLRFESKGAFKAVDGMAASPNGELVAVHGYAWSEPPAVAKTPDGVVAIVELGTGQVRHVIDVRGDEGQLFQTTRMAYSPDGNRLAVSTNSGRLTIVDVQSGAILVEQQPPEDRHVTGWTWSPDARMLYSVDESGVLRGFDSSSGAVVSTLELGPGDQLTDAAYDPVSSSIFVSSSSGMVYVVDVAAQEPRVLGALSAGGRSLEGVALTPDGRTVAAINKSGFVYLWDRASGQLIGPPLSGHPNRPTGVVFVDGGGLLATTDRQGLVLWWPMTPETWVAAACRIAGRDLTPAEWQEFLPDHELRSTCAGR